MFAHNGHDLITASEAEGNACIWRCSPDFTDYKKMVLHCDISKRIRVVLNRFLQMSVKGEIK